MNPYSRLLGLLPSRPLLVGEVVDFTAGVATILMPGGGLSTARGDVTVGTRVFFRDGAIEGTTAPDLTEEVIDV